MHIGFIGLGQMGLAMAENVLAAGHDLTVWNRSPDKADALVARGARRAATPADAARGDVVMSMLADDRAVESVVYGADGMAGASALHISHSTISVALADRLTADFAEAGGFVSAPVFGRPPAAQAAQLFVVAAGGDDALDRCDPLLGAVGQRTFRVGTRPSAANIIKLSGNFMIMAAVEAMAEASSLAEKGGVDPAALMEVLTNSLFGAPIYKVYGDILLERKFRPAGFAAPLGLKDMNLVDAAATGFSAPMPLLGIVRDHLRSLIAQDGEDIDWGAIALPVRRAAGLE